MRWQLPILLLGLAFGTAHRLRRQIVAPTWLRDPIRLPALQASKVVVTPQNLQETAAIRAAIQKAVAEDTYVVAARPPPSLFPRQELLTSLGSGSMMPMLLLAPATLNQTWNPTLPMLGMFNLWSAMVG
ncbi:uncharacterized protein LOC117591190 isoform X1 [Drosophila guanche]|uniref:uncharacterized protein LOC117591190 isoform X1 n=1 Tax=Drosophila guanche TaxID=7266 RepID=UPI001471E34F|nr:uncharacterized protein LOC117591190 isoform X1 [Drosophila guanche]